MYEYEKDGEKKEFEFPMGEAPQEFKGWKKVISYPSNVFFRGPGFASSGSHYDIP